MIVFVDVDDTIMRSAGTKRIPMPRAIERVRKLHAEGNVLYLWSAGGADYARSTADELGISQCFTGFLPKPHLILDDMPMDRWPNCTYEYPA